MKYFALAMLMSALALAQTSSVSYLTDLNGRRVEGIATVTTKAAPGTTETTDLRRSVNGREVPLEQVETRVLREDASGKTVEKIIKRYDQTGRLATTEREVIEEQKRADGGSTARSTVYRSDINGRPLEAERRVTETRVQGSMMVAETAVERPSISGSFEIAAKNTRVIEKTATGDNLTDTDFRKTQDGQFTEAYRRVIAETKSGATTKVQAAEYEPGVTGRMELARQSVATTTKQPGGASVTELNLYSRSPENGRTQRADAPQQILEQQIIERVPGPNGQVTEVVSARRPSVSDPNRLGELRKISETVCRGKCVDDKP